MNIRTHLCAALTRGRAERLIRESIVLLHGMGHTLGLTTCLEILAEVAGLCKQPERMVRLCRPRHPAVPRRAARLRATADDARAVLSGIAFDAAWMAGQTLTLEQAVAYGLLGSGQMPNGEHLGRRRTTSS